MKNINNYDNEEIHYYKFRFENKNNNNETDDSNNNKFEITTLGILYSEHDPLTPMQVGFSENMNQGINIEAARNVFIEDINVYNLEPKTGSVFGISICRAADIRLSGTIKENTLAARYSIDSNRFRYDDRPNKASEVRAVRIYAEYNGYTAITSVILKIVEIIIAMDVEWIQI